jgi:hypothetical protein
MPPANAAAEQISNKRIPHPIGGILKDTTIPLKITPRKIAIPPILGTAFACTFCIPAKSESNANPRDFAYLMMYKVNKVDTIKLMKKEDMFYCAIKMRQMRGKSASKADIDFFRPRRNRKYRPIQDYCKKRAARTARINAIWVRSIGMHRYSPHFY